MNPFQVIQLANETAQLTISFRGALEYAVREHKGETLPVARLAELIAEDEDVVDMWAEASDFPRRDYMTFAAEHAHRSGVTAAAFAPESADEGLSPAAQYATDLIELARDEIAAAADPSASLLPESPAQVKVGPVGCYAVSTVCDSSEPEEDKIRACALLIAAAHLAATAGTVPA